MRIQSRTVEQIVDVPVPMAAETIVEMPNIITEERVQNRTVEQIWDTI